MTKDVGTTIKPSGGGAYSVIVAATADETAVEDAVPSAKDEYHGLLTYYLNQVVRGSSDLTYDEAARRAAAYVTARAPSQHPQAEGDTNRILLGGATEHKDPYIRVLDVGDDHKKFRIGAGLASGLQNGAVLAVYDKNAKELVGDEGRIANAQVIEVSDFDAAAQLMDPPKSPLTTDSKVKVITPFAPLGGMPVFIPTIEPDANFPAVLTAVSFLEQVKQGLTENKLVSVVDDPHSAKLVVRWTCQSDGTGVTDLEATLVQPKVAHCPSGISFYLSPVDRPFEVQESGQKGYRVYDIAVSSSSPDGVAKLVAAIGAYAAQNNLRTLTNQTSRIKGLHPNEATSIRIELERVKQVTTQNGLKHYESLSFSARRYIKWVNWPGRLRR